MIVDKWRKVAKVILPFESHLRKRTTPGRKAVLTKVNF